MKPESGKLRLLFQGTAEKCLEQAVSKEEGAQKPECTQST